MIPVLKLGNGYRWLVNPYAFLNDAQAKYGLSFRVELPVLGDVLMTGDPEMIRDIIQNRDLVGGKGISALRAILGEDSLIMLNGDAHRARRRIVAPPFSGKEAVRYDKMILDATLDVIQDIPLNRSFSIYNVVLKISFKAIIRTIFGCKPPDEETHIESLVENFLYSFKNPLILFLKPLQFDFGRFSPWGKAILNRNRLSSFIISQIKSYRDSGDKGLSILAHIAEKSRLNDTITDQEIASEILALLMFGRDTGAATMAWAFAHIYQKPEIINRIRKEAIECKDANGKINVKKHIYLESCIKESMRLCPVVVHLTRVAEQDTKVGTYNVKSGEKVLPCTYLAQHNLEVFPKPNDFIPDRFMNGKCYDFSFFPFGIGSRTCIGEPFVLRQMVLMLSTIINQVDLALAPGFEPKPVRQLVLIVPRGGTRMIKYI